jgi:subtilisin family serine protease
MIRASRWPGAAVGAVLCLIASACGGDSAPLAPQESSQLAARKASLGSNGERRYVIVLKEGVTADLRPAIEKAGGKVKASNQQIGVYTVSGLSDAAVAALAQRVDVEAVTADVKVQWIPPMSQRKVRVIHGNSANLRKHTDQSGAAFFTVWQWNMRVIQADKAWLSTNQGRGALVCVLDTGIDPTHLDTQGKVDESLSTSFIEDEAPNTDGDGHGTFVAAIVSSNGVGVASVAPDAVLCSIKVLDKTGLGNFGDVISGIYAATVNGADVINMSLGAYFSRNEEGAKELVHALQRAVNFAFGHGVLVVAATGNDGVNLNTDSKDMIEAPAELDHVQSVGATGPFNQTNFDHIPSYSDFGRSGVDVFAPGGGDAIVDDNGNITNPTDLIIGPCSPSTINFGGCTPADYLIGNGTSFATAHVSGEGAVIESQLQRDQTGARLADCIDKSADKITGKRNDRILAHGRINVLRGASCEAAPGGALVAAR